MVTSLFLFGCVLAAGQPGERSEWLLPPRLTRGQELVYSGSYAEEAAGRGVQFNRAYRLECRVLVLEAGPKGTEVALFTRLKLRDLPAGRSGVSSPAGDAEASSVRVELARIDPQGKLMAGPGVAALPLDGPPSLESGSFVEVPRHRVGLDQPWEVPEDGRPVRTWKAVGSELAGGVRCLKLVGVQQSEDWDRPRADRIAWRRTDTVWFDTALGVAYRVERVVEQRAAAHTQPTSRSVLRYERETSLPYPRQLFEERRREILQAKAFGEALAPLLANPAKHKTEVETLLARITYHLEHEPPTPYRDAVVQVKRRAEAARRGEAPPPAPADPAVPDAVAVPGQAAPDFVAPDLMTKESARLRRWQGRPVLLVFYNPASVTATELLRFAQAVQDSRRAGIAVIGLAVTDDPELVRRQHDQMQLTFPVLDGSGLRHSYAVEATPKLMLVDGEGTVRAAYDGWSRETPGEIVEELKRWLPK